MQRVRSSENHIVHLAKGSFWLLGSHMIASITAFMVTILITRALSTEAFGQYRFILAIIPILTIFTLPGISQTLVRSTALGNGINLVSVAIAKMKWGLFGSVLSLLIAAYYAFQSNTLFAYAFLISALCIPLVESFFVYSAYYRGKEDFKTSALYDSITRIFYTLSLAVTVLITQNILIILFVFFASQIISRLFFFVKTVTSQLPYQERNDDSVSYGKNLFPITATQIFINSIDKILVWHFLGAEMLALYIVALLIPTELARAFGVIPQVVLPKIVKGAFTARKEISVTLIYFFLSTLTISILYIFLISPIINIAFPNYNQAVSLALAATPLIVLTPLRMLLDTIFLARKETVLLTYFILTEAVLSVGLIYIILAMSTYGLFGVTIILSLKVFLLLVLQVVSLQRASSSRR
tara:strand:+ start:8342 stop:9574 length:1233 start_codon:yes stop_codon:yes gene_type:complete